MKVLFVASVVSHLISFHIPFLKFFSDRGFEVHIAANGEEEIPFVDVRHRINFARSPLSKSNIKAYRELKRVILENDFDLIHCHTPVASILTRFAARNARKKGTKVVYTAHGFHFYKGAPLINWLIYYPVERLAAHFTDALVTINHEDYERAKKFAAQKVYYIPGMGVDCEKLAQTVEKESDLRESWGIPQNAFVVLSVGELNQNKNHKVILEAIHKISDENVYYVICGKGNQTEALQNLAKEYAMENQLKLVGFQTNISEWLSTADIFAFPSIREGLAVSLMEAMAAGLPCVASDIRGNNDLFVHAERKFLYKPHDVEGYVEAIASFKTDFSLRETIGRKNQELVKKFDISQAKKAMIQIYEDVLQ